ncbi:hypothetical protein EON65_55210 [archaeon]|nr:MAG: hypothetical protein EON65_55210 [archaeon]
MEGHDAQSDELVPFHSNRQVIEEEHSDYGAIGHVVMVRSIPHMTVLGEDRADPTLRYRRHLTLEELMFAWNAVIVYIMCMISIMCFTVILLLCLYGDKLFSDV